MATGPSDEEKARMVESFSAFTGLTDPVRARFYLESSGWNLDMAAGGYFEAGDDRGMEEELAPPVAPAPSQSSVKQETTGKGSGSKPVSSGSSRFATISSLAPDAGSGSDDETGETYYAGGSERGAGQQIVGPPRKGAKASGKLIDGVFKAAKERGAETVESLESASTSGSRPVFQGAAYRLGDTSEPSERLDDGSTAAARPQTQIDVTLYMWRNGFSVDDGPLREFQSPEGREFIESITRGEVPRELIRAARGAEVALNMVDKRTEDYVAPKKKIQSFAGEGHRLGSPTDTLTVPAASASGSSVDDVARQQKDAEESVAIDNSAPTTSIQIRLVDGSRLVAKFNQSHTVSDVRRYIVTARPEYGGVEFTLMTTFPNKELTDESQSLLNAGLINAVLVIKPAGKK